jgi:inner membrane protein
VAGLIAISCAAWVHYVPVIRTNSDQENSGFIPFFYDWKKEYDTGVVDGAEWKENRLKFL